MPLCAVNEKIIGKKLKYPIYSSEGIVILNKGVALTKNMIDRLKQTGIGTVYVEDENSRDIKLKEVLNTPLQLQLIKALKQIFLEVQKEKSLNIEGVRKIVTEILDNINTSENAVLYFNNLIPDKDSLPHHSLYVAILSTLVGINRAYNYTQLVNLCIGALLHDIGKLLTKSPKEHTEVGYRFLKEQREISPTSYICAYSHHEHVDGTGYPRQLKGNQIYEFAKIVSICDRYDHLIMDKKMLPHEAFEKIMSEVGTKFDNDIYKSFTTAVYCYPTGLLVQLNNDQKGIVIQQNKNFPQRPIVKVINTPKENYINLLEHLNVFVKKVIV